VQLSRLNSLARPFATVPPAKGHVRATAAGPSGRLAVASRVAVRVYAYTGLTQSLNTPCSVSVSGSSPAGAGALSLLCEYTLAPVLSPALTEALAAVAAHAGGERPRRNSSAAALLGAFGSGGTGPWGGGTNSGHNFVCIVSTQWVGDALCVGVVRRVDVALYDDALDEEDSVPVLCLVEDAETWTGTGASPAATRSGSVPDTGFRLSYLYLRVGADGAPHIVREVRAGQAPPLDANGEIATSLPTGPGGLCATSDGTAYTPSPTSAQSAAANNVLSLVGASSGGGGAAGAWGSLLSPSAAGYQHQGVTLWGSTAVLRDSGDDDDAEGEAASREGGWGASATHTAPRREASGLLGVVRGGRRGAGDDGDSGGDDGARRGSASGPVSSSRRGTLSGLAAVGVDDLIDRVTPPLRRVSVRRPTATAASAGPGWGGSAAGSGSLATPLPNRGDGEEGVSVAGDSPDVDAAGRARAGSGESFASMSSQADGDLWAANVVIAVDVEGADDDAWDGEGGGFMTDTLAPGGYRSSIVNRRRSTRFSTQAVHGGVAGGINGGTASTAPSHGVARAVGYVVEEDGPRSSFASASEARIHFTSLPLALYASPVFPYAIAIQVGGRGCWLSRMRARRSATLPPSCLVRSTTASACTTPTSATCPRPFASPRPWASRCAPWTLPAACRLPTADGICTCRRTWPPWRQRCKRRCARRNACGCTDARAW